MHIRFFILVLSLFICFTSQSIGKEIVYPMAEAKVYFSPRGGAEQAIVNALDCAKDEVRLMAYSFTAKPIADALIRSHKRGVHVTVILDKSQLKARASKMKDLVNHGILVYVDRAHAIAHNKVIIIDKKTIITGSYNFSQAAEQRNAENVLIMDAKELAQRYLQNFEKHMQHSIRIVKF